MKCVRQIFGFSFFFLVLLAGLSFAQDTGQLTGTVHDVSGAMIPNAQVSVSSPERGINRETRTNSTGEYLVGGLPAGTYNLTVGASGFKTYQAKNIVLRVADKTRADASLQVGAANSEVTVQGESIGQVQTQSAEMSGVITGKEISQLQLNGRNFTQLATLVPGVSNQTGQDEGTVGINGNVSFSFNGGRTEYNNWELDGGDNMDNGSNATLNVYPSVDAIAEVKVLTSNYGAQYGRSGSGTVEVETKSGTSSFHGDAYEFVRNDMFNAKNYFSYTPPLVPEYKKNDYGYTLGGPIYIPNHYNTNKQKTFFFWSEEWRQERVPGEVFNVPVPSNAERQGNFSDVCPGPDCPVDPSTGQPYAGYQVPISAAGAALLPLIPAANSVTSAGSYYNASPVQPMYWREELLRVDHNINDKWHVMFRFAHDSWNTVSPTSQWTGSSFPTVQTNFVGPAVSMVGRVTTNFTPTLLNEFVMSYTTDHISFTSTGTPNPTAWQRPSGLAIGSLYDNGFGGKLPAISLNGNPEYGSGSIYEDPNGEWPEGPYNSNPTYTYRDNVTKIVGRHNLQFGAYYVAAQKNERSGVLVNGSLTFDATDAAISTGNAFADLLTGQIASYSQGSNNIKFYNRYKILEPYFQDDWRATQRLTLSLGLRISMFGTYREKNKNAYNWDPAAYTAADAPLIDTTGNVTGFAGAIIPGSGNIYDGLMQCGVNKVPVGCESGHLFNPAPRIGFAWDPFGDGKTAIRGGYGIFFEHTNGNEGNTESLEGQSSPLLQTSNQVNISGYQNIGSGTTGTTPQYPLSFISLPNKVQWPYVQQWHLDVQHEITKDTVLVLAYVGSKGTHLTEQSDLNQLQPVPASQNPFKPGEVLSQVCGINQVTTPSGVPITGQAAINVAVACGADPNSYRPYYGASTITRIGTMANSSYNAFQLAARRNVGQFQLNVAYTWSHSIDDSSDRYDGSFVNSYDLAANRASSSFDIRHMLNVGYVWEMPFFKSGGLTRLFLGGWELSGITSWQTGTPFSVINTGGIGDNAGVGNGVGTGSYADVVSNPYSNTPNTPLAQYGPLVANPAAYVEPAALTFGNSGRNSLRNPGYTNWNMSLFKNIKMNERFALQFRAEAFNVFNHTEWASVAGDAGSAAGNGLASGTNGTGCYGGPNNSAGDPSCAGSTFLYIGAAHPPRILQLGLKLVF